MLIRDLRDLTRARTSLSQEHSRIASRIQKVLEDANIKLASVASNTLGKSGRAMLAAIIEGEESPQRLADLALGHLRVKIPQLQTALEGQVRDHHRFLLRSLLRQLQFLEAEIESLDARLDQIGREHLDLTEALDRWITVPGVDRVAAWSFIAEMGIDVAQFSTAAHLASWAGVCPGNNESAGKRISRPVKGAHGCVAWLASPHGLLPVQRTPTCQPSLRDSRPVAVESAPSLLWPQHLGDWISPSTEALHVCRPGQHLF